MFLTAVATQPLRYIAVDREVLRALLFEDGPLSDLLLSTFIARREALQRVQGVGLEIVGPRSSEATMRMLDFARSNRLPFTWQRRRRAGLDRRGLPLVRLPGGAELRAPSTGEVSRALGIGLELAPREEVDLLVVGAGPAGLGAAVYGASEGLDTLVVESTALGGQAGSSRRIENYLGFPAGISGTELTSRAVTQARKFGARHGDAVSRGRRSSRATDRHVVRLEEDREVDARTVLIATGAQYRRLPVDGLSDYEGMSVFYAAGPPEAQLCGASRVGVVGGGNSAGQAAVWLARGGALVTLLHRRSDLQETMSDYLIRELERRAWPFAPLRGRRAPRNRRPARGGDAERRRARAVLVSLPVPRRVALHGVARRRRRARRARLHRHRRAARRRVPARDERPRRLRGRRRPLGLDEALRDGGRRRRDGRPARPRALELDGRVATRWAECVEPSRLQPRWVGV